MAKIRSVIPTDDKLRLLWSPALEFSFKVLAATLVVLGGATLAVVGSAMTESVFALEEPAPDTKPDGHACVRHQIAFMKDVGGGRYAVPLNGLHLDAIEDSLESASADRATVACHMLAAMDSDLASFQPSSRAPAVLLLSPDLESRRDQVTDLVDQTLKKVWAEWAAQAPLSVHLFVGTNLQSLQHQASLAGLDMDDWEWPGDRWDGRCSRPGFVSGYANAYRTVICLPGGAAIYDFSDRRTKQVFATTVAHEFFHNFQHQVSGVPGGFDYRLDPKFGSPGPYWMLEGVAYYIGHRMSETTEEIRSRLENTVSDYGYSQEDRCRILKRQEASFEATSGPRAVALLAVMDLEDKAGSDSFARFYGSVGLTLDWRASFEKVYGDTPEVVLGCADRG